MPTPFFTARGMLVRARQIENIVLDALSTMARQFTACVDEERYRGGMASSKLLGEEKIIVDGVRGIS